MRKLRFFVLSIIQVFTFFSIQIYSDSDVNQNVQLKLYWDERNMWSWIFGRRHWCMACTNSDCLGGDVVLKECDQADPSQKWLLSESKNINPGSNPTFCLSYQRLRAVSIRACKSIKDSCQIVETEESTEGIFEIRANERCIAPGGFPLNIPYAGDKLQLVPCNDGRLNGVTRWVSGDFDGHCPTAKPSSQPSEIPTNEPTLTPSLSPTVTVVPSKTPTNRPSSLPTLPPTLNPSKSPTLSNEPSKTPTTFPTPTPTESARPSLTPSHEPSLRPTNEPTRYPTASPSIAPTVSSNPTFATNNGFYNNGDVCEKKIDGICPCFPQDDDWYCDSGGMLSWIIPGVNNVLSDRKYRKCDTTKFQKCNNFQKLCPMRKPRLDRYYGNDPDDVYYYIDYDCIRCVPKSENCSKCSPGIWCEGVRRCVGPAKVQWCRKTFPEYFNLQE